jgi:hypothetical protein
MQEAPLHKRKFGANSLERARESETEALKARSIFPHAALQVSNRRPWMRSHLRVSQPQAPPQ